MFFLSEGEHYRLENSTPKFRLGLSKPLLAIKGSRSSRCRFAAAFSFGPNLS